MKPERVEAMLVFFAGAGACLFFVSVGDAPGAPIAFWWD